MTDTELNKALALKIGWREDQIREHQGVVYVAEHPERLVFISTRFDFMDWNTIMPIAVKYGVETGCNRFSHYAFIPGKRMAAVHEKALQKAIALAVINNP